MTPRRGHGTFQVSNSSLIASQTRLTVDFDRAASAPRVSSVPRSFGPWIVTAPAVVLRVVGQCPLRLPVTIPRS